MRRDGGTMDEGTVAGRAVGTDDAETLQARVERHVLGRSLISGVIALVLVSMLVSNLPASELRRQAMPIVEPVLDATGLGQSWRLFAPDPRNTTWRLAARMTYADGATFEWHQPEGHPVLGPYRAYRWRKFAARIMVDSGREQRADFASWLADRHRRGGARPERIVLVKQTSRPPEPGSGERRAEPWQEEILYRTTFVAGGEA